MVGYSVREFQVALDTFDARGQVEHARLLIEGKEGSVAAVARSLKVSNPSSPRVAFCGWRACRLRGRESGPAVLEAVQMDEGMM